MISVLSPAKTLDFESEIPTTQTTVPEFVSDSEKIMTKLKTLSARKLQALMSVSPDLAKLNYNRNQVWEADFTSESSRPAILAFRGNVYQGLDARSFDEQDLAFAQDHLRILSGLHGLLKPLDLIRPYRLEMGTKLPIRRRKNLYHFWDQKITDKINEGLSVQEHPVLVNLASNEYFKAIQPDKLQGKLINCHFKDLKNGEYKIVMTFAKIARGMMSAYIIKNRITEPELLKGFDSAGYGFNARLSTESDWVFTRDQPQS